MIANSPVWLSISHNANNFSPLLIRCLRSLVSLKFLVSFDITFPPTPKELAKTQNEISIRKFSPFSCNSRAKVLSPLFPNQTEEKLCSFHSPNCWNESYFLINSPGRLLLPPFLRFYWHSRRWAIIIRPKYQLGCGWFSLIWLNCLHRTPKPFVAQSRSSRSHNQNYRDDIGFISPPCLGYEPWNSRTPISNQRELYFNFPRSWY